MLSPIYQLFNKLRCLILQNRYPWCAFIVLTSLTFSVLWQSQIQKNWSLYSSIMPLTVTLTVVIIMAVFVRPKLAQDQLQQMSKKQINQVLQNHFVQQGFELSDNQGKDAAIWLSQQQGLFLVQLKHGSFSPCQLTHIREYFKRHTYHEAVLSFIVSSNGFTTEAKQFAQNKPLLLIDETELAEFVIEQTR